MKIQTMIATTIVALSLAVPTFALPVTFAQFDQTHPGQAFTFTNHNGSGTNLELTANVPVEFEFLVPNGTGTLAPTTIQATLVMTAIADPAVTVGTNVIEPYSSVSMVFTADTPINGHTNLLTVVSTTTGTLTSKTNANSASLNGDSGAGDTVTFTSDFLNFGSTVTRDYDLSFSSLNPRMSIANGTLGTTAHFPKTFSTSGTGTFGSDPAPTFGTPEPSPALALLIGAGLTLLFVRNRKIASARPLSA